MSEQPEPTPTRHGGLVGRLERAGRNEIIIALNRIAGIVALPVIAFLGLQVWSDIKDGQKSNADGLVKVGEKIDGIADDLREKLGGVAEELRQKIDGVADDVDAVQVNQAVTDTNVRSLQQRIDRLELQPPAAPSKSKGRS
jgi:hypothetical protein